MSINSRLASDIARIWPLPIEEAAALSRYVGAQRVAFQAGKQPVRLESDGRFRVDLTMETPPDANPTAPLGWQRRTMRGGIILLTNVRFHALRGMPVLSSSDRDFLGLSSAPLDPITERCCAGLSRAMQAGNRRGAQELLERVFGMRGSANQTLYAAIDAGVMTDAQAAAIRPPFQKAWDSFKKQGLNSSRHIADIIGGYVQINKDLPLALGGWRNFCTVRISYALNQAGYKILYTRKEDEAGPRTVSGKNGDWYMFRVSNLKEYLKERWGDADITVTGALGTLTFSHLKGKQGVLVFDMPGGAQYTGGDQFTGHATLWNGTETRDHTDHYIGSADAIRLWVLP